MPQETEPSKEISNQELKDFEWQQIQKKYRNFRFKPGEINHNVLLVCLTSLEHKYIGSTEDGQAYHPNYPLAFFGGNTLEEINAARAKIDTTEFLVLYMKDHGYHYSPARLLPINQGQLDSEAPAKTWQLIKEGIPELAEDAGKDMQERAEEAQKETKERLKKEVIR